MSYSEDWGKRNNKPKEKKWRKPFLVFIFLLLAVQVGWEVYRWIKTNRFYQSVNHLAVGDHAKTSQVGAPLSGPIQIQINRLLPDVSLTKAMIHQIRESAFSSYPILLSTPYQSSPVFEYIRDNTPWISESDYYLASGSKEYASNSPASGLALVNPLLLLLPDFKILSTNGKLKWNKEKLRAAKPDANVPFFPRPSSLTVEPTVSKIEALYFMNQHIALLNEWAETPITSSDLEFRLQAINALDFGYKYLKLAVDESINIQSGSNSLEGINLSLVLFKENGCGQGLGCNVEISQVGGIGNIKVLALPAKAVFHMWPSKPKDVTAQPALRYSMIFE